MQWLKVTQPCAILNLYAFLSVEHNRVKLSIQWPIIVTQLSNTTTKHHTITIKVVRVSRALYWEAQR